MFETKKQQADFLDKFNISDDVFRASQMTWEELDLIAKDYEPKRNGHQGTVANYAEIIRQCPGVHSLRFRVKETDHLIAKIIRKNPEYLENGDSITKDNYYKKITDLMGIRALLLFKEDWVLVHEYIMERYGNQLHEPPFVYVCEGDTTSLYDGKIEVKTKKLYRSVHYVVEHNGVGIEIQIRTLYEEAWSEIDHKLRYPYDMKNEMLTNYIDIMNQVTKIGDEMGTFIHAYLKYFAESTKHGVVNDNEVYHSILQEIEKCDDVEVKQRVIDIIKKADNYREMKKVSELLKQIL